MSLFLAKKTLTGPDETGGPNGRQTNSGLCVKEMQGTSVCPQPSVSKETSHLWKHISQTIVVENGEEEKKCNCCINQENNTIFP